MAKFTQFLNEKDNNIIMFDRFKFGIENEELKTKNVRIKNGTEYRISRKLSMYQGTYDLSYANITSGALSMKIVKLNDDTYLGQLSCTMESDTKTVLYTSHFFEDIYKSEEKALKGVEGMIPKFCKTYPNIVDFFYIEVRLPKEE